jgi:hypothetical protein
MPTYQHQIVAIRQGLEADRNRELTALQGILSVGGDKNPLTGLSRTHTPHTDQDAQPDERRLVQVTIAGLLRRWADAEAALLDVQYTREVGNTRATAAAVTVDGREILPAVPVGILLFIEDELKTMLGAVIGRLQARDPAEEWQPDESNLPGVWRSAPRETLSTTKRVVPTPAWPPAADVPTPPVEWRDTDVVTGRWAWVKFSGQLSIHEIYEIHNRCSALLAAVRAAREEANRIEVEQQHAGQGILSYVFGDLLG